MRGLALNADMQSKGNVSSFDEATMPKVVQTRDLTWKGPVTAPLLPRLTRTSEQHNILAQLWVFLPFLLTIDFQQTTISNHQTLSTPAR